MLKVKSVSLVNIFFRCWAVDTIYLNCRRWPGPYNKKAIPHQSVSPVFTSNQNVCRRIQIKYSHGAAHMTHKSKIFWIDFSNWKNDTQIRWVHMEKPRTITAKITTNTSSHKIHYLKSQKIVWPIVPLFQNRCLIYVKC